MSASEPKKIVCLCTTCKEDFGGVTAFDLHRVGKHEYLFSEEHPDGRRCLSSEEMLEKKMKLDKYGRWRAPGRNLPPWAREGEIEVEDEEVSD
jgi:hypothetical protein